MGTAYYAIEQYKLEKAKARAEKIKIKLQQINIVLDELRNQFSQCIKKAEDKDKEAHSRAMRAYFDQQWLCREGKYDEAKTSMMSLEQDAGIMNFSKAVRYCISTKVDIVEVDKITDLKPEDGIKKQLHVGIGYKLGFITDPEKYKNLTPEQACYDLLERKYE